MEKAKLRIFLIDPVVSDHSIVQETLARSEIPASLEIAESFRGNPEELPKNIDLILTNHHPPQINALGLLRDLKRQEIPTPVILLTHHGEMRTVRDAFKLGAKDYLLKEELQSISLIDVISGVLEDNNRLETDQQTARQLRDRASRDGLTQLFNQRHFLDNLEKECLRAYRFSRPLSLLMIDMDGFKPINDICGHPIGDRVLVQVAGVIQKEVRSVDLVARYGGDEFAVLLPETESRHAEQVAQRILSRLKNNPFLHRKRIFPLSASIGVASLSPKTKGAAALLRTADQALYVAKRTGRGKAVVGSHQKESQGIQLLISCLEPTAATG